MDGLPVRQQDNAKVTIVHLSHLAPASNTPIRLNNLPNWGLDSALNPHILNQGPIGTLTYRLEITCELHVTERTARMNVGAATQRRVSLVIVLQGIALQLPDEIAHILASADFCFEQGL